MQIERLIREQIYLAKRRNQYRFMKRSTLYTFNSRKVFGLICIVVGLLLILTRCSKDSTNKSTTQEKVTQNTQVNKTTAATDIKEEMTQEEYYTYIQDFNVDENTLLQLYNLSLKNRKPYSDTLAIWMVENYKGTASKQILKMIKSPEGINTLLNDSLYETASHIYSQFIYDLVCFPLSSKKKYSFENGWKQARSYNGARQHYGIDIMDPQNTPGQIKIFSITDGVIESIGWNEVGGYRVGIRSNGGAYFYYAHLNENPSHIQKGDAIFAGDYLGDMGDTGYGKEGTRGKFPVHLHVGIAVKAKGNDEFWVNPYYILRYLELKDFVYKSL
ncbi:M23 family metallopeptidase [Cellulosilyticum sp. I15G10I2]|uniref:M23 family metallopeptidase n=1 Tax=Cellulosilyticum sp. I15G10I2 TaxID=1892843 RepID=UPI0014958074|nr:M23 family metallopeptidase [Cellulosilyticum sp. I15G10I2]